MIFRDESRRYDRDTVAKLTFEIPAAPESRRAPSISAPPEMAAALHETLSAREEASPLGNPPR
jgi:hypothetical protein